MRYLIIGGTGTLGKELVSRLYRGNQVDVFSRDEFKQSRMKQAFPTVRFFLGDIRDWVSLSSLSFKEYDAVFHCAALKHVDLGESNVDQFVMTNYVGTSNICRKCNGKSKLVYFSTDKAVMPVNAYGMSKALGEKYIQSNDLEATIFRWGNILGSRGSILDKFYQLIRNNEPVPITDVRMTRFWLTMHEAISYVLENYSKGRACEPMIPPVKASKVVDLARAIGQIVGKPAKFTEIGIRPGEKLHETLLVDKNYALSSDTCEQFEMEELIGKIRQVMKG